MNFDLNITYNGNCEAAFRLYEQCLGGKITTLLTYGDSPVAAQHLDLADKIVHATLQIGECRLSGTDAPPSQYVERKGFTIQLNLDSPSEARRIFQALAEDAHVLLPLQETFWAHLYAVLTDRFGTPWKINCSKPH